MRTRSCDRFRVALLLALTLLNACGDPDRPLTTAVREELPRAVTLQIRMSGAHPPDQSTDPSTLTNLAIRARQQLLAERSVDALHASALIDIATAGADHEPLDRAIALLEEASATDSLNPALPNDIAAAYLLRSTARNSITDLFHALAGAERAVSLDSLFEEALFNRAVVLRRLALHNHAEQAWRDYSASRRAREWDRISEHHRVSLDTTARNARATWDSLWQQWRQLARASVLHSATTLIGEAPQHAREFLSVDVLGEWGRSLKAGRATDAERALRFAAALAPVHARESADSSVYDAIVRINAATESERLVLAAGHAAYADGRDHYSAGKPDAAASAFTDAITTLRRANSDFAWYPALYKAAVDLFGGNYAASDGAAHEFLRSIAAERSPVLAARANYILGLGHARRGRAERGISHYQTAATLYQRAGEIPNHTLMQTLEAEALSALGEAEAGFRNWVASIEELQREGTSTTLHNTMVVFGRAAGRAGFTNAMAAIHAEGLYIADRTGRVSDPIEARLEVARTELDLGRHATAAQHVAEARDLLAAVADSTLRQRIEADLAFVEGLLATKSDARSAIRSFARSADHFRELGNHVNLLRVLTARSRLSARIGDTSHASADLLEAVRLVERASLSTTAPQLRASLHSASVAAYDQLIRLHFARNETDLAFKYLERSRLPARPGTNHPVPSARELAARLPARTLLVEYAVLEDELLIRALSRETTRTRSVAISKADLAVRVERFVRLASTGSDSVATVNSGHALRSVLLDPIEPELDGIDELLIVADHSLLGVPFALLPAHTPGRYLIEDHTLRMIPAAAYVQPEPRSSFSRASSILLAGDVSANAALPELPRLAAAGRELDSIAALYRQTKQLRGGAATPSKLLRHASAVDIIHFAGHARFTSDQPDRSYLVLAPDSADDSGLLFAERLENITLRPSSLVILSACSSGSRTPTRAGGFSGLAQAFVAAGAAGVVGSLWEVEDASTGRLLVAFHRALVTGATPAEALRTAQVALIREHANPAVWGAFRYEGL